MCKIKLIITKKQTVLGFGSFYTLLPALTFDLFNLTVSSCTLECGCNKLPKF